MKKILYTANTDQHINLCHIPYIKYLSEENIVHVATNTDILIDYSDKKISIPIKRTPFHLSNITSIFKLKKVIDKEKYDLIITNTPMGSVVTRLAALSARKKYNTKIVYIAHGFHFFSGCPFKNYLIYYPIEKILSKYTDTIITINEEDYNLAFNKFYCNVEFINGIGFDKRKFLTNLNLKEQVDLKNKLEIKNSDFVIIYIAEISKRKRQIYFLEVLKQMNLKNTKILLAGNNILGKKVNKLIKKYKLEDSVKLLGFRDDISELLDISDLVISVSCQEGLPLHILEAMYKNKNILVTNCRGNRDLINNQNGRIVPLDDKKALIEAINYFKEKKSNFKNKNNSLKYELDNVCEKYYKIFNSYLGDKK